MNIFLGEEAAAARLGLDLMAFVAEHLRHLFHAHAFVDRFLDQLTRPFDPDDLHRTAAVLVSRDVDKRHPDAARGNTVTVEQSSVKGEKQIRGRRQHDPDVHVALHTHRRPQFAFRNSDFTDEIIDHPLKFRKICVRADLFSDAEHFFFRNNEVKGVQIN